MGVDVSQNAQSPEEAAPVVAEVAAEADGNLDNRALREAERVEGEAEDGGVDGERQVAAPAAEAAIDEAAQSRVERVRQYCIIFDPQFIVLLPVLCHSYTSLSICPQHAGLVFAL